MRIKLKLSIVLLLGLGITELQAQESINAIGGDASGSGGSASYSVGQVVYTINLGTNSSMIQGVQQPYEISAVLGIEEVQDINLSVKIYPNPTTDFLHLKVESEKLDDLSYRLYDLNGKLLQTKKLLGTKTEIDLNGYESAIYFVRVVSGHQSFKEYKIIKI
ncbi:MAG: T9SS type A sorting domain-containing protein [Gelidibacter sp.]|nr:T9SS type A sorting domain-containing protein [Gelidibacter sp.]